jgi:hypothetical protein
MENSANDELNEDNDDLAMNLLLAAAEDVSSNRPKAKSIPWNEQREFVLTHFVYRNQAFKRTKKKKEVKWEKVKKDVFDHPLSKDITPIDLSKKFERMVKSVKKNFRFRP